MRRPLHSTIGALCTALVLAGPAQEYDPCHPTRRLGCSPWAPISSRTGALMAVQGISWSGVIVRIA